MLTVTPPIAVDTDAIWVLVSSPNTGAVDAARMAHRPGTDRFIALPCLVFDTAALLPVCKASGEPLDGFRWATVADLLDHAHLFVTH